MLHLIESNMTADSLASLLASVNNNDALVLLNDGTYLAKTIQAKQIQASPLLKVYILEQHANIRGIHIPETIQPITMLLLVALTATHKNSATW